jgi:hypothetical protein
MLFLKYLKHILEESSHFPTYSEVKYSGRNMPETTKILLTIQFARKKAKRHRQDLRLK